MPRRFALPTAGNAGVAAAAYAAAAGPRCGSSRPTTTPPTFCSQIAAFGAELRTVDGHIGDCGKARWSLGAGPARVDRLHPARALPDRGEEDARLEMAEQFGWRLPDVIVYPTGGGTGLIGMWKAFLELRRWVGRG